MIPIPPFLAGAAGKWLVVVLVVVAAATTGYIHGRAHEQGIQAERDLKAERAFGNRLLELSQRDRALIGRITADLGAERAERAAQADEFERKLAEAPRETIIEVPATCSAPTAEPGAIPSVVVPARAPIPRLTAIGCGLWNDALASGTTAAERAEWLAGANPCAGPVEIDDALRNVKANALLLGQCRAREEKTLKWMEEVGLTTKGGE